MELAPQVDFADWFNNPQHSDVLLQITTQALDAAGEGEALDDTGNHEPATTYHAHALLLVSQSTYLSARLSNRWTLRQPSHLAPPLQPPSHRHHPSDPTGIIAVASAPLVGTDTAAEAGDEAASSRGVQVLVEHVEADELPAMDLLMRLLYGHGIPQASPSRLLFQTLKLADCFGCLAVLDRVLAHLAVYVEGDRPLSASFLGNFFLAPPSVFERPGFQPLREAAEQAMGRLFGHLPSVIRSPDLICQFCALPFLAVLAWSDSDQLFVHSENDVLFLSSAWVAAQQRSGQGPTPVELEMLAHYVRVYQLGPAYLHHVLPSLPWFTACSGMASLPSLHMYKAHGVRLEAGLANARMPVAGHSQLTTVCWEGPGAWVAAPRRHCHGETTSPLVWHFDPGNLQTLTAGAAVASPDACYSHGLLLRAVLRLVDTEPSAVSSGTALASASGVSLDLHLAVDAQAMAQHGLLWPPAASVLLGPVDVQVLGRSPALCRQRSYGHARFMQGCESRAYRDVLIRSAPTAQELVGPYLREGELRVQALFSAVDRTMG